MAASARYTLLRAAVAVAVVTTVDGCATRYDAYGNTDWLALGWSTRR